MYDDKCTTKKKNISLLMETILKWGGGILPRKPAKNEYLHHLRYSAAPHTMISL